MTSDIQKNSVIQIDWKNKDGTVTVTPRDHDRYVVKVRTVVERLQQGAHFEAFEDKLRLLQRELAGWLGDKNGLREAYLTFRDGGFLFLVITEGAECDEELDDQLTDLDIKLAKDSDLSDLSVDVLAIPNASPTAVATFIDPGFAVFFTPSEAVHAE